MPPLYEYKVVPAPSRPAKIKGLRGTPDRFAHALAEQMNTLAQEGWEYQRAETLPCDERSGLTGKTTSFQNVLVFRRAITEATLTPEDTAEPQAAPAPKRSSLLRKNAAPAAPDPEHSAPETAQELQTAASASLTTPSTDAATDAKAPS